MNADDQDDQDQQPDFRLLLKNSKGKSQALPSRDAKGAQDPKAVLEEQYDAFFQVISDERRYQEKSLSRAVYVPDMGLFRLTMNKGTHFVSMGHTLKGNIHLYPEEALYLVDRSSLLVEHNGTDITIQQTWDICLSQQQVHSGPWANGLTLDRYIAYAYLKRLGYIVTRPGTYDSTTGAEPGAIATPTSSALTAKFSDSGLEQILQKIRIIPNLRLVQYEGEPARTKENDNWKHKVDFEVYKPAGGFKKRQPGIPDYRVVVVSSRNRIPTLDELSEMMEGLIDPAQAMVSSNHSDLTSDKSTGKDKKTKSPKWPMVLFAVVDGGQVSFLSLSNPK
ncbi:tRNA splicing endonuclease 54 [Linnemannia zychae]|nr:tRNA splicing endonuclease 54 [Linnemannia zychae]